MRITTKEYFRNMHGLEWFSWFVLKPIALLLSVVALWVL